MFRKILLITIYGGLFLAIFSWWLFRFLGHNESTKNRVGQKQIIDDTTDGLLFIKTTDTDQDLYLLDNRDELIALTHTPEIKEREADMSTDGKKIILVVEKSDQFELWLWDKKDNIKKILTFSNNPLFYPRFSPQGKKILYVKNNNNGFELYVYDLISSEQFRIASDITNVSWTGNDQQILFSAETPKEAIYVTTLKSNSEPEQPKMILSDRSSFAFRNQEIFSFKKSTSWQLVKTNLRGEQEKVVLDLQFEPEDPKPENINIISDTIFTFSRLSQPQTEIQELWLIDTTQREPILLNTNLSTPIKNEMQEFFAEQKGNETSNIVRIDLTTRQPKVIFKNFQLAKKILPKKNFQKDNVIYKKIRDITGDKQAEIFTVTKDSKDSFTWRISDTDEQKVLFEDRGASYPLFIRNFQEENGEFPVQIIRFAVDSENYFIRWTGKNFEKLPLQP